MTVVRSTLVFHHVPEIRAARSYAPKARHLAVRLKNPADEEARKSASREMAPLIPGGSVLVPVPSSTGRNPAMLILARELSRLVEDTIVLEAVERTSPVPSSWSLRHAGLSVPSTRVHVRSMSLATPPHPGRRIVVIDNVVATGNTLTAVQHVLGRRVLAVVYADARRAARHIAA